MIGLPNVRRRLPVRATATAVMLLSCIAACGKKGPPLAPFVEIPAAVQKVDARRVGQDIYVTVVVPANNMDTSKPAHLARIDVFGATATQAPPREQFLQIATLVAAIDVPEVPRDSDGLPLPLPSPPSGPAQGSLVTIRDSLTADDLVPRTVPARPSSLRTLPPVVGAAPPPTTPRRFYIAVPVNERNQNGPPGALAEIPLTPLPEAPRNVQITYTKEMVSLTWQPSGGLLGFLLDRALPAEPSPVDEDILPVAVKTADLPPGPTLYNVYRTIAPDPVAETAAAAAGASVTPWNTLPPVPINPLPISEFQFSDEVQFERERCYTVRAVRGTPPATVEGEPSEPQCVRPIDIFPPAPPTGVSAIAAEGAISLIWEPNVEDDFGGYIILRDRPGDAALRPLGVVPVLTSGYTDHDVVAGVRYTYAVVAIDNRVPVPNMSAESERVQETAK